MRKTIVRTITATTIESTNVTFEKGEPKFSPNKPLIINGVLTEEKALKLVRKEFGENSHIKEIKSVNDMYEISVEDFLKYATKVQIPTPDTEEDNQE